MPLPSETDPNDELGHWLRSYKESHPGSRALDATLPERLLVLGNNRRRADRAIWTGLGRKPGVYDLPTIVVEFVSQRLRDRIRDYEIKRDEYLAAGIMEYWVIDRFRGTMTVFTRVRGQVRSRTLRSGQIYRTPRLPGFEMNFGRLIDLANAWRGGDAGEE